MEAVCSSETLACTQKSTRHCNQKTNIHIFTAVRNPKTDTVVFFFIFTASFIKVIVQNALKNFRQRPMGDKSDRTQRSQIKAEKPLIPKLSITARQQNNMLKPTSNYFPIGTNPALCPVLLSHSPFPSSTHDTLRQSVRQRWVVSAGTPGVASLRPKGPPAQRRT